MIVDEFAAVKARLVADGALAVRDTVYAADGSVFQGSYVVLFGGAPDKLDDERATKAQTTGSDATYVFTVRCVSTTPGGARSVLQHVMAQLVGFVPTVSGRSFDPMALTHSKDVEDDATVKPPLFWSDTEFTLVSRST